MNIPLSTLEPFGVIGMPSIEMPIMYRHASRQIEIAINKAQRWLVSYVFSNLNPDWSDDQIARFLEAELLHEAGWWLDASVKSTYTQNGKMTIRLTHLKKNITRVVAIT